MPTRIDQSGKAGAMLQPSTWVAIATKGRPKEVAQLLHHLQRQTVLPAGVILSGSDPSDIPPLPDGLNTHVLLGPAGLALQRNRALAAVPADADYVIFFDDDFIPSRLWIERVQNVFAARPDATIVTGLVIADGVKFGGIERASGLSMVERTDGDTASDDKEGYQMRANAPPYGCNMAFRWTRIRGITFDERLVLHGWLEDRDFGARATARNGVAYWTNALWGVHLGINYARVSHESFGYSQVVNPLYLLKKGVMTPLEAAGFVAQGVALNALKLLLRDPHVDRWRRFKGNMLAIADIATGRWKPERTALLD
jgi:hypothetical protein